MAYIKKKGNNNMSNSVNLSLDVTKTGIQNPLIKVRQEDGGFETLRTTVTSNGEPMDLQGWTITFMGTTAGNHKIVDTNVTVVEAPNGIFDYTPSKAWGMDIGEFKIAYFKFEKGDGTASSANFRVNVIEAVDLTQEEAQNYISIVDATIATINQHLTDSLANVTQSIAATSSAESSLSVQVSSAVNQVNSAVSNISSVASNATSNVNSVASSAVSNIHSVASSAASYITVNDDKLVHKTGTETIVGDKTFNGNVNFSGSVNIVSATTRGQIFDGFDLNNYTNTYKYVINGANNILNYPSGASHYATLEVERINGDTSTQKIIDADKRVFISSVWGVPIHRTPWIELSNNDNVVHNTGTETISGYKSFTGELSASVLKVSGDNYANTASVYVNYLGATLSFVRIGKLVTFTSGVSSFNTNVPIGLTTNVIPNGFKPALQQNIRAANQSGSAKFFSFNDDGGIYSYETYASGEQPRLSGTYITTNTWPV